MKRTDQSVNRLRQDSKVEADGSARWIGKIMRAEIQARRAQKREGLSLFKRTRSVKRDGRRRRPEKRWRSGESEFLEDEAIGIVNRDSLSAMSGIFGRLALLALAK